MSAGVFRLPEPRNESVRDYAPGSPERAALKARLDELAGSTAEIPMVIGGREVRTGRTGTAVMPHDHEHVLAEFHRGGEAEVAQAIAAAADAREEWSQTPWEARAAVFMRAADLLAGPWRDTLNAATMLGQSKTAYQAEVDAACELVDFWRFNLTYMHRIMSEQPVSAPGMWNRIEYRPLEGFVFAVSPFNFTAIAGNLPTAAAMMGNTVVFKPASTAVYSAHFLMRLYEAAGLPPGVINMVLGSGREIGAAALAQQAVALFYNATIARYHYLTWFLTMVVVMVWAHEVGMGWLKRRYPVMSDRILSHPWSHRLASGLSRLQKVAT